MDNAPSQPALKRGVGGGDKVTSVTPSLVPASVLLAAARPDWLIQWGHFATETTPSNLPQALLKQAKLILLDCIGAMAAGMQETETSALAARLAGRNKSGHVAAIGAGIKLCAADAAFANGIAGTTLELDEGNQYARGHPGIHVLPAALAACCLTQSSGAALLRAFSLGYEVGARIGIASRLRSSVHPHGSWGTVGAALAVALLNNGNASQCAEIISLSASLSVAPSLRTMFEGATVRNSYCGFSNRNGLEAWDLVASGFTGERDGVKSVYSSILGEEFRPEDMLKDLGTRWEMQRNYFKRHAACRFVHGALDVVMQLNASSELQDLSRIRRIEVETYSLAAQLDATEPQNMLAAKFSLPFAIATTLIHGKASVPAFRVNAVMDERIRKLAQRVEVLENPGFSALLPDQRPARLTIEFDDGSVMTGETFNNRGDFTSPYHSDEVIEKYFELTVPIWGQAHAEKIHAEIDGLEQQESLGSLNDLLAAPPGH